MRKTMILFGLGIGGALMAQPPVVTTGLDGLCTGDQCGPAERGLHAFVDREVSGLGGNGRACAECHMPTNSFQLSPANVEARYQSLLFRRQLDPRADDVHAPIVQVGRRFPPNNARGTRKRGPHG